MAAFKIYSKHYVDNHILLLFFFYLVKWKYEQFLFFAKKNKSWLYVTNFHLFCRKSHHISRNWNWAVCCYTKNLKALIKKTPFCHILATIYFTNSKQNYCCWRWHKDWAVIQNLHFCRLYKSIYQVKCKSADLLTIPLCPNLLDWTI